MIELTGFNHSWAEAHEEHTVLLVLRIELGHNDVERRLCRCVYSARLGFEVVDQVEIGVAAREGDDFLDLSFQNEG